MTYDDNYAVDPGEMWMTDFEDYGEWMAWLFRPTDEDILEEILEDPEVSVEDKAQIRTDMFFDRGISPNRLYSRLARFL